MQCVTEFPTKRETGETCSMLVQNLFLERAGDPSEACETRSLPRLEMTEQFAAAEGPASCVLRLACCHVP